MQTIKYLSLLFLAVSLFGSCEQQKTQNEEDRDTILKYIEDNNLNAIEHPSGMYYIIHEEGVGTEMPSANARVEVKYKGYFTDGTVFDQSPGANTVEFGLTQLVVGWQIGVPLMKKEGRATFIFPSALGYGFFGSGPVPPNTVIIFDVELINFSG